MNYRCEKCGEMLVDLVELEPAAPANNTGRPSPEPGHRQACARCDRLILTDPVRQLWEHLA